MGVIVSLIATAICAVFYIRMIKREVPERIGKKAAWLPIAIGFLAPLASTALMMLEGLIVMKTVGKTLSELIPSEAINSFVGAFLSAAFPEELVKLLILLLVVKIVKPKNVYEYGLLGAGVGMGFTLLEDALYGGGSVVTALIRIPFFGMHMSFNLIMGILLGLARYNKENNTGTPGLYSCMAFLVPVCWHTLFDTATTFNPVLKENPTLSETMTTVYAVAALVLVVVSIAAQFVLLHRFKKKTDDYCSMTFKVKGTDEKVSVNE